MYKMNIKYNYKFSLYLFSLENKFNYCFFVLKSNMKIMKRNKIIYLIATGLLSVLLLMSVGMYLFNNTEVSVMFTSFGFPTYVIYPLAAAKVLGLFAIWNPKFNVLKEWAYAGFFFNFILAFFAHHMIGDGEQMGALIAMVLLIVSYIFSKKQA